MKNIKCLLILLFVFGATSFAKADEWTGTGFALKGKYVITNHHVVDGARTLKVRGVRGDFTKMYNAVVVAKDESHDMAIIRIEDNSFPGFGEIPYTLKSGLSEVGENIFVLGYPLLSSMGEEVKLTTGIISSRSGFQGEVSSYQVSAPIQPGNSGGPLFDVNGDVVGIVNAKHRQADNASYAIKSPYMRLFIQNSVGGSIIPTNRKMVGWSLISKVKSIKPFVFIIYASTEASESTHHSPQPTQPALPSQSFVEDAGCGLNMKMVYVEGGTFQMGATSEQESPDSDEKPVHSVTLDSYYIAECEVTQAQWQKIMGTTVYQQRDKKGSDNSMRGVGDNHPMYYVSWSEAQAFCNELSRITGKTYVLPTEAQWEYAARGGKHKEGTQYSGSYSVDAVAWYDGTSGNTTHPVKQKRANKLGLYDMSGNVYEWCSDWYGSCSSSSQTNPTGPSSGSLRVLRGGSWDYAARYCRVSDRSNASPSSRNIRSGFRVVCLP